MSNIQFEKLGTAMSYILITFYSSFLDLPLDINFNDRQAILDTIKIKMCPVAFNNFGSSNDLVPSGNKSLPEAMLTLSHVDILRPWAIMG